MTEKQLLAPEYISDLVEQGDRQRLRLLLNDQYPADLAECLNDLSPTHRITCFRLLDLDNASGLLAELEPEALPIEKSVDWRVASPQLQSWV